MTRASNATWLQSVQTSQPTEVQQQPRYAQHSVPGIGCEPKNGQADAVASHTTSFDGLMAAQILKGGERTNRFWTRALQEPGRCDMLQTKSSSHLASAMSPAKAKQM